MLFAGATVITINGQNHSSSNVQDESGGTSYFAAFLHTFLTESWAMSCCRYYRKYCGKTARNTTYRTDSGASSFVHQHKSPQAPSTRLYEDATHLWRSNCGKTLVERTQQTCTQKEKHCMSRTIRKMRHVSLKPSRSSLDLRELLHNVPHGWGGVCVLRCSPNCDVCGVTLDRLLWCELFRYQKKKSRVFPVFLERRRLSRVTMPATNIKYA